MLKKRLCFTKVIKKRATLWNFAESQEAKVFKYDAVAGSPNGLATLFFYWLAVQVTSVSVPGYWGQNSTHLFQLLDASRIALAISLTMRTHYNITVQFCTTHQRKSCIQPTSKFTCFLLSKVQALLFIPVDSKLWPNNMGIVKARDISHPYFFRLPQCICLAHESNFGGVLKSPRGKKTVP